MRDYLDAVAMGDYGRACAHLSPLVKRDMAEFARQDMPGSGSGECVEILERILAAADRGELRAQLEQVEITRVEIDRDRATVVLEGATDPPRLRKIDGEWKISRLSFSM